MESESTQAQTPSMSEAVSIGGIIDTGKESFGVDVLADKVAERNNEDEYPGNTKAVSDGDETDGEKPGDTEKREKEDETKSNEDQGNDSDLPKGVQKRIDKMRRKQGDLERETERLRAENAKLKAMHDKASVDENEPDITTFDTETEYIKALTDYRIKQAMAEKAVEKADEDLKNAKADEEKVKEERHKAIQGSLKEAEKKYDDFNKVVIENKSLSITEQMVDIMIELPNMGEIAYRLGKNPERSAEIAEMPFAKQAFALKEISDELKSKKTTKAPRPIRSLGATGGDLKALSDMSYPEYVKYREKQEKERRGG